jgi:acyl-CoA thioesterase I
MSVFIRTSAGPADGSLSRLVRLSLALLLPFMGPSALSSETGQERRVILVLGDSLAAGHGLDPDQAFPSLLQQKIHEENLPFTVVNAGVSGDTTAGGLRRLDWLLRRKLDVLLLELGGNDGLRGIAPQTTRSNLQAIIDRTQERYPEARVIIAGMKMPPNMGSEYSGQFEQIFPEVAKQNNAPLIPFLLEGVGGIPELNLPDRIHPNEAGQKIVADNVWKVLRPFLQEMKAGDGNSSSKPAQAVDREG